MAGLTQKNLFSEQPTASQLSAAVIPDKRYFKIGEVCKIIGVKQHVVRYWETEFKQFVKPQRAGSKQRLYRRADIENLLRIKQLLKGDGFTIPGARKFLSSHPVSAADADSRQTGPRAELLCPDDQGDLIGEIKDGLKSLLLFLEGNK